MAISGCRNISDLRRAALRRLPAPIFHFIDGGAEDETGLRRSTTAFEDVQLLPRYLVDVGAVDLRTRLLGRTFALPLVLSPTGLNRLFHPAGELAVARAAADEGLLYSLSTMGTASIEAVAAASAGPKMFQVYVFKDRGLTQEHVERAKAAGYHALCLTVDTPMSGNRERDALYGLTIPPRLTLRALAAFALRPRWVFDHLTAPKLTLANVAHRAGDAAGEGAGVAAYVNRQFDRSLTWDDAAWLAKLWGGPLVIKGLLAPDDARRALDCGATAVMVSSHGGRQLDGVPAPLDCLKAMRDEVGDRLELILDGGVRRGTHILKALAAGANACSIGRAYLYGLAAGGEAGVRHALGLLRSELERDMVLTGCRSLADLGPHCLAGGPLPTALSAPALSAAS
ncbi:MAG: alpha-hydroxy-acid oxidizing protein [Geminicoccaceae bacterium]|nr:MAG: alpha-hydroxy-acid oxidizing protein [Geminicoccaceae bacterium]